jgi:Cu(I)/Ag(I) efflux system periplasmic protein CusF
LKNLVSVLFASLALAFSVGAIAQTPATAKEMTAAEVRKIDKETGRITLKHEEIKSLDMPSMTMVFVVTDKALLNTVKVGDKIKFNADKQQGKFVVTAIEQEDKK